MDAISFSYLNNVLKYMSIAKNCKNSQQYYDYFRTIIETLVIVLYLKKLELPNISGLKKWLTSIDWPRLIAQIVLYINFFNIQNIYTNATPQTKSNIATTLVAKNDKWEIVSSFILFEKHNKEFLYKELFSIKDLNSQNCS